MELRVMLSCVVRIDNTNDIDIKDVNEAIKESKEAFLNDTQMWEFISEGYPHYNESVELEVLK